jgi:hypothetical protein
MLTLLALASHLALAGVSGLPMQRCDACATPADAVELAAGQEGTPVIARRYVVTVRSVQERDGIVYLNSQREVRDQLNVSIELSGDVAAALRASLETDDLATALRGQTLVVFGQAQRVRVGMGNAEAAQRFYFYRTVLAVAHVDQIARFAPQ